MGKLPTLKPREVVALLEGLGFAELRQKGFPQAVPPCRWSWDHMKQTSVEHIGRSQPIPGVRRTIAMFLKFMGC